MIYVTGDLHGDLNRFRGKAFRKLRRNDTLIVCGDFGFLWDGSPREKRRLKWIGKRKYQVLFVEGTHDNLELLEQYPVEQWNGGLVHEISGKLRHLIRGSVFEIEGKTIFAFGGGESEDADVRGEKWWSEELPTPEEIEKARCGLAARDNRVDYIVTHDCSRKLKYFLRMDANEANILDLFLDEVRAGCTFSRWFFGRYHINKAIPPAEAALYNAVISAESGRP